MPKLFLKITLGDFVNESRDKRELSVVGSFTGDIIILARGQYNHIESSDGYIIHRRTTRPISNNDRLSWLNRFFSIFTWASYARSLKPYCISCQNLIELLIGWLSTWFIVKSRKPKLVYDSHEFEIGRNTEGKRGKLMKLILPRLEKFLMERCDFSIMVNDSIADEVQRIHKLRQRPLVVRNIPAYWNIDEKICRQRRLEFCQELDVSEGTFIVMYHGGVTSGRGIEKLLMAVEKDDNIAAVILGDGEEDYVGRVKRQAAELNISDRVLFLSAVPVDILWQYVGAADAGMANVEAVCLSYFYSLPNKIFENIQALTPVIGSDFPEIRRIVKGYDIGLCVDPEDTDEIVEAIEKLRMDTNMYLRFKNNLRQAKEELCWENESGILENAYRNILG